MQGEDQVRRRLVGDGTERTSPFGDSFLPSLVWNLLGFRVDMELVVIADKFLEKLI